MDHQGFAQLLGNYGEFVGAIAVVVTLMFLTIQVRQNNKALTASTEERKAEALNNFSQSISQWNMNVFGDADLSDLVIRGRYGQLTNDGESVRFLEVASQFFVRNRAVYASAVASGNTGQAKMTIVGTAFNITEYPGMKNVWEQRQRYLANLVVPEFVSAVESRIYEIAGGGTDKT
jgi:hypothetical protein